MQASVLLLTVVACGRTDDGATPSATAPPKDDMVFVPAGPFLMGDPPHSVSLDAFRIDRTEVTQGDYDLCVSAGVCDPAFTLGEVIKAPPPWHPVVYVSPDEAATYCAWLGKQLPTEAQWEKAARGIDGRTYPWGEDPPTCERALFEYQTPKLEACGAKPFTGTHPVGAHPSGASPYGALDMAGNVMEWVADMDPAGFYVARGDRVVGGSVNLLRVTERRLVRPPERSTFKDDLPQLQKARDQIIGFRCVREARRHRER